MKYLRNALAICTAVSCGIATPERVLLANGVEPATYACAAAAATAPIAAQVITSERNWSDAARWPGGRLPRAGEHVTIAAGEHVVVDVNTAALRSLTVAGKLSFADGGAATELTAGYIYVSGLLEVGTESAPFHSRATITINGPESEEAHGMGSRFLATMEGGSLQLHGASAAKRSWTQLDGSLGVSATTLRLADVTGWEVGDEIVIAPSGWDPNEAERVTVTAIEGRELAFAPALRYRHFGEIQRYGGRDVDERAEVGLLTRNILVQGPESAEAERLGAHGMIMAGSGDVGVEGVAFRRMGQPGKAARYTFHWHLAGVRDGDYFRDNSIYDGLQRGVVVHGTDSVRVERNVVYNVRNHAYIPAEDGNEVGNKFIGNLAVLTRSVEDGYFAFQHSSSPGRSTQGEQRVACFWLRNLHNTLVGNHAAGAERGVGFFYDAFGKSREHVAYDKVRRNVEFRDNVAHSISVPGNRFNEGVANTAMYGQVGHGHGLFFDDFQTGDDAPVYRFERFTAYKCDMSGIWNEVDEVRFTDLVLADNATALQTGAAYVDRALVVGRTANDIGGENRGLRHGQRRAGYYTVAQGGRKRPRLSDVTFLNVGFDVREGGAAAALIADYHLSYRDNYVEGVTTDGYAPVFMDDGGAKGKKPSAAAVWDRDGTLTGRGVGQLVVHDNNPLVRPDCEYVDRWDAWLCPQDQYLDAVLHWNDRRRYGFHLTGPTGRVGHSGGFSDKANRVRIAEAYGVQFEGADGPQADFTLELSRFAASPGGYAYFDVPFPFGGARLLDERGAKVPRLGSEDAVRGASEPSYYFDRVAGRIFVKAYAPDSGIRSITFAVADETSRVAEAVRTRVTGIAVWPNPLRAQGTLSYSLTQPSAVAIDIVDAAGRSVAATAAGGELPAGKHTAAVSAEHLAAGVYFVRIDADGEVSQLPITIH